MLVLKYFLIIFLGAAIGSFINVLVDRGQKNKSLLGFSACDFCGYRLKWFDNVPILSFLFLRGKCRKCSKKLSWQYPLVEAFMAAAFLLTAQSRGFFAGTLDTGASIELMFLLVTVFLFGAVFLWDLKYMIIPDQLVIGGLLVAVIYALYQLIFFGCESFSAGCPFVSNLIGALAVGGFFYLLYAISNGKWIGGGDVKAGFWLGFLAGWQSAFQMLMIAYILGALVSIPLLITKKKKMKSELPFGPFLILGAFITLLFGEKILYYYYSLIGM